MFLLDVIQTVGQLIRLRDILWRGASTKGVLNVLWRDIGDNNTSTRIR